MKMGVLVTGFPALRAQAVVRQLLSEGGQTGIVALVHPERIDEANTWIEAQRTSGDVRATERLRLLEGDPAAMDFGLAGPAYLELCRGVEHVHAAYSIVDPNVGEELAESVNVGATRELLELTKVASGLRSAVFYSSVFVSGTRSGRVLEVELSRGQSFRSPAERTLAISERMLRLSRAPISTLRAGHLLGDFEGRTIDYFGAPHLLAVLVASAPKDVTLPIPSGAEAPLPLTPVDYLARVGTFVTRAERPAATYHALSPERFTLRRFLELVAQRSGKRLEPGFNPGALTRSLLGNPATRLLPQNARGILEVLTTSAEYAMDVMAELTAHGAPRCPPLESYLDPMLDHIWERLDDSSLAGGRPHRPSFLVA